jgi:uncharacterized caspase-like protein
MNDNGTSPEANLSIKWKEPEKPVKEVLVDTVNAVVKDSVKTVVEDTIKAVVEKPTLYILAIGISDYDNPMYQLDYAAKDAKDFTAAFRKQKGLLYSDVVDSLLTDKQATKDNILRGFQWIQDITSKKDVAIIFFSGHGYSDVKTYYMLPVNANITQMKATCLNFAELKQTQASIEGKVIVFIDACHSGDLMSKGINGLVNIMTSTDDGDAGVITFTSSIGKEESIEDPQWQNGAFTKALIAGLYDPKSGDEENNITYKYLDLFISRYIPKLTGDKQHPTMVPTPNTPDFPIAKKL